MFLIVKIRDRGVLVLGLGTQRGVYPPKESTVESQLYNHFIWWGLTGWWGLLGYVSTYFHWIEAARILG